MKILNRENSLNNSIEVQKTQKRRSREYINIRRKKGKFSRGVWYMFSNNNFQFLNNITHISTHYFHPHIYPNMFLNNNFQVLSACTKHLPNVHNCATSRFTNFQHIVTHLLPYHFTNPNHTHKIYPPNFPSINQTHKIQTQNPNGRTSF